MLLDVDDEANVLATPDLLDGIAHACEQRDLAPVDLRDRDLDVDPLPERCRRQVVDRDVDSDRAFTLVQVLLDEIQTGVLDVAHHGRRAVEAHFLAEKADGRSRSMVMRSVREVPGSSVDRITPPSVSSRISEASGAHENPCLNAQWQVGVV